ncbi:hypothetical protein PR048_027576 [Dryococelus australis]|uniref:Uncharacterized protein n=1 Tax=Dryococelus australis TaxID=614101 RepID=A0ABQ9GGX9_9NEOP|nr:hypothetical protein PR048_027576 [Dryococelus australis]
MRRHWFARTGEAGIPEKTCRHVASSSTIPTCENPGAGPPGIGPGSSWWEASALATAPQPPLFPVNKNGKEHDENSICLWQFARTMFVLLRVGLSLVENVWDQTGQGQRQRRWIRKVSSVSCGRIFLRRTPDVYTSPLPNLTPNHEQTPPPVHNGSESIRVDYVNPHTWRGAKIGLGCEDCQRHVAIVNVLVSCGTWCGDARPRDD